ncbi:MAG: hypothetical protein HOI02_02105 [Rhodospirillaceae bacterium]|nr:hypothetical protein [Rhodospirillaceae bacterium]MBT5778186.1 hypothetical protein [Rhodospirillaceae bacterium]
MQLTRKTAQPKLQKNWKIYLAPLLIAAAAALSLQACMSSKDVRALEPAYRIPYRAEPLKIANCAADLLKVEDNYFRKLSIIGTEKHVRVSAPSSGQSNSYLMWEALLKNGEAQIRISKSQFDTKYADKFAEYVQTCDEKLTVSGG